MSIFDDLKKSTAEISAISKLNKAIKTENDNIAAQYSALGKAYYEAHAADAEPELAVFCESISNSISEVQRLSDEINLAKGFVKCANCGALAPKESKFCNSCGSPVSGSTPTTEEAPAPDANVCKACGTALAEGAAFCANCGAKQE